MTRVTDEMVEAALDAWCHGRNWAFPEDAKDLTERLFRHDMRAALEAALAVAPAEAPKADVKWIALYPPCLFPDACGRRGQNDCTNMACPVPFQGMPKP